MKKPFSIAILIALAAGFAASAHAETEWQKNHPRRHEVNKRLKHQDKRIHEEVKSGEISKAQAHDLHQQDHAIRQEERDMAAQNNGHITKSEQRALNQQENAVHQEIKNP